MSEPQQKSKPAIRVTKLGKPAKQSEVVASRALEAEDEFRPFYADDSLGAGMALLEPPYNPAILQTLCSENNTLGPCIAAMVTNVDETGHIIEPKKKAVKPPPAPKTPSMPSPQGLPVQAPPSGQLLALGQPPKPETPPAPVEEPVDPKIEQLNAFFDEVYPGLSFMQLRTKLRRDLEKTGNAYIEVLRNLEGRLVFLRHIPARTFRCMRLDKPILVTKKIKRGDEELEVQVMVRERRYAQMVGAVWIYFREFGSSRHLNSETGWWEDEGNPVPLNKRATEVIHLTLNTHDYTPYGMPRWEGQIPSVLGSRRAEEFNLEFFDTGGIPPALVTLAGGTMAEEARKALETQFNAKNRSKHRVAILETQATSGSLDAAGKVEIDVHTFGSERQSDGMFDNFDNKCHLRVRRSFRLPPLFLGEVESFNFATAYASYLVAENQVFRPERESFDSMVNRLLMPELGGEDYVFRSKNLTVADIQTKLAALQIAGATNRVDPKQVVDVINEVADLDLKATDQPVVDPGMAALGMPAVSDPGLKEGGVGTGALNAKVPVHDGGFKPPTPEAAPNLGGDFGAPRQGKIQGPVAKNDFEVLALADKAMLALRKRDMQSIAHVLKQTDALSPLQKTQFKAAMALRTYFDPSIDPEGMSELAGCSLVGMSRAKGRA